VFFKTADLFNLEADLVCYDTTTCSFSIDQGDDDDDEGLRKFGHSKEGSWSPQVVVALAVTKQGLPVRSRVFPGNTGDVATVAKVKQDLKGWKPGRALFVGDGGMNSEENRQMLARACGTYVLAVRAGSGSEVQEEVLSRPGRYRELSDNLRAKEVVVGEGERRRRYILCFNPKEAERQSRHRAQVPEEIEAKLLQHQVRQATAKWAIGLMASKRWGRYLKVGSGDQVVVDQEKVRKAERMDGKWVLITNDDTLSLDDAAAAYKNLAVIERCFRTLKRTELSMSPMYHWLPRRIEAHVKICVFGLLLERIVEVEVGRPWRRVRKAPERLRVTEYQNGSHRFFRRNEVPPEAAAILKKLKIPLPKPVLAVTSQ
jgi:transposase